MEQEDLIREQMEDTRTSLTEKLETLEKQVAGTVLGTTSNLAEKVGDDSSPGRSRPEGLTSSGFCSSRPGAFAIACSNASTSLLLASFAGIFPGTAASIFSAAFCGDPVGGFVGGDSASLKT